MLTRMDELEKLIDDARKDAGWKWSELARRADLHQQTLRRYRSGEVRTDDTTRAIEIAFGWPRGYIDALAEGREPPSEPAEPEPERADTEPKQDAYDDLITRLDQLKVDLEALRNQDRRGA